MQTHGYSHTDTINETYVNQLTDRVLYQCWHRDDLRVVPYNLQMMMDWDSYINVEYSGSGHCVQYLYKYLFKGPARRERIEMYSEQERDPHDEIELFIYGQVVCAMGAMWHFYGYQDYPASIPAVCSFLSANYTSIGFYCQIWQVLRFASLIKQTNRVRKLQVC